MPVVCPLILFILASMSLTLQLPRWFDLHTHFRQGENVTAYIRDHLAMGCAGALAMPNTSPAGVPGFLEKIWRTVGPLKNTEPRSSKRGAKQFEQLLVPLYLTGSTTRTRDRRQARERES